MTKYQLTINDFIDRYWIKHKKKPYLYEIVEGIESADKVVAKSLKMMFGCYPDKLMVSTTQKKLYDQFEEGMTIQNLADKVGITYDNIIHHMYGIEKLGAKFKPVKGVYTGRLERIPRRKTKYSAKESMAEKVVGVRVKYGTYKGMLGYVDNDLKVVLHINGIEKRIEMECFDYEEIR